MEDDEELKKGLKASLAEGGNHPQAGGAASGIARAVATAATASSGPGAVVAVTAYVGSGTVVDLADDLM